MTTISPVPTLKPGQTLGGYEIISFHGRGGMGEIFRARQLSIGREVALKILNPELARRDPQFATKFVDEARAAGRLNHPNIVAVHDVGRIKSATSDEYLHYFSMEFVDGENLREVIDREGTCPQPLVEKVMLGMADALVYAEAMNMLHRDIKPENIMVAVDGRIKLADFGLAQEMDSEGTQADRDEKGRVRVMGTPRYMSPEQARGRPLDARSDQYSLGATLYHLLTGTPPYRRESGRATMKAHVSDPVPDPGELVRVSPPWRSLCMRLMAKLPEERFATAAELKQAVEQAIRGHAIRPQSLRSRRQEFPTENPSKGPGRALILVAGVMVVFAAGAFFFTGGDAFDLISEQNSPEEDGGETSDHALAQQRAEDIISSLPADLDVAIANLNAALANPYFQSAPSAQAMLANHLTELRMQRQERDQALQEQRQQLSQRLQAAVDHAQANRFHEAQEILTSFRREDRQMVGNDFARTRERIQGFLVARYEHFAERMGTISNADAGAVLLAEAGAEGLPTNFLSRLENDRDERISALEAAIVARQAEAQRMVEQRLDTMFEVLGRLRGDGAERIPQFDRFTRLASDYRNRFSEPDLQELCAGLVRIAQLAQAMHGRMDGFLRAQQPVITLNFGTGPTQARIEGMEGAMVSLLFSRSGARTRRSLADPEIDHAHLAKLAQEHLSLSQDHLAAYLWMWGLKNSPNFSDGALGLAAQRFSGQADGGNTAESLAGGSGNHTDTADGANKASPTLPLSETINLAERGQEALRWFEGEGLSIHERGLRWLCEVNLRLTDLREILMPTLALKQPLSPPFKVEINLQVEAGSLVMIGLRQAGQAVRLGLDTRNQRMGGVITDASGQLRSNPLPRPDDRVSRPMNLVIQMDARGAVSFTVNGVGYQASRQDFTLPNDGPAELVIQALNTNNVSSVVIRQIRIDPES